LQTVPHEVMDVLPQFISRSRLSQVDHSNSETQKEIVNPFIERTDCGSLNLRKFGGIHGTTIPSAKEKGKMKKAITVVLLSLTLSASSFACQFSHITSAVVSVSKAAGKVVKPVAVEVYKVVKYIVT
jgi:hypothetical protein